VMLGVSLLKSVSEEFVSDKEDAPMSRKKFLKETLTSQLDTILGRSEELELMNRIYGECGEEFIECI
jgi:hypothetical protein